jgi:hypothetical protein
MDDLPSRARALLVQEWVIGVGGPVAAAGCLLPWERLEVSSADVVDSTSLDAFHGSGLATCAGATLALLILAYRLWRVTPTGQPTLLIGLAGLLMAAGAALFTTFGGFRPQSGAAYSVRLGPGLLISGVAGVVILGAVLLGRWSATVARPEAADTST